MNRHVIHLASWGVLVSTLGLAPTPAPADTAGVRVRHASQAVQEALRCEIRGSDEARNESLRTVLQQEPDHAPALWHTGHVREDNRWVKFDEVPNRSPRDEILNQYRLRRQQADQTVEGQLTLAGWCTRHRLRDQARAHLTEVLRIDPNHAEARRRLGHRRLGNAWLSPEEIEQFRAQADGLAKNLRAWAPRMKSIAHALTRSEGRKRRAAIDRLLAIRDPAAIPAMELVLAEESDESGVLVTRVLDKMSGNEASLGLARQALFSPFHTVPHAAAERLRDRKMESYVPAILSAMSTPIQSSAELYVTPRGRLTYRQMFYREAQYHAERVVFDTEYSDPILSPDARTGLREGLAGSQQRDALNRSRQFAAAMVEQNAAIAQINRRACDVLAVATRQDAMPTPESWWQWWNDHNETYLSTDKPVREFYNREEIPTPQPPMYECLIAGTPVWTDSGLVPIEQIRVGDRVLSQDPETGELAYKPVLRTTLRPPARLVKVVFDGEALQSSGGHPFWVAGEGWIKARDLKPGTRLHTVSGTSEVWSAHPTGYEETHNLVVADFHTYFVTRAKILSHDNTIREPTDAVVPGLAGR